MIKHFKSQDFYDVANLLRQKTSNITNIILCAVVLKEEQKEEMQRYVEEQNYNGIKLEVLTKENLQKGNDNG